jgi:hypothetical protein
MPGRIQLAIPHHEEPSQQSSTPIDFVACGGCCYSPWPTSEELKTMKLSLAIVAAISCSFANAEGNPSPAMDMATAHSNVAKAAEIGDVRVPKAAGANARTVEEIVTKSAELNNKPVTIHAKVVKFNGEIMGKNWLHLRDGSGSASDNTNDLLVTTADSAKVGDVVTVEGVVHTNRDFGSGYSYKVMVEEASLK